MSFFNSFNSPFSRQVAGRHGRRLAIAVRFEEETVPARSSIRMRAGRLTWAIERPELPDYFAGQLLAWELSSRSGGLDPMDQYRNAYLDRTICLKLPGGMIAGISRRHGAELLHTFYSPFAVLLLEEIVDGAGLLTVTPRLIGEISPSFAGQRMAAGGCMSQYSFPVKFSGYPSGHALALTFLGKFQILPFDRWIHDWCPLVFRFDFFNIFGALYREDGGRGENGRLFLSFSIMPGGSWAN